MLESFLSYLKGHSQRMSVHGAVSDVLSLLCGVPQGISPSPSYFHNVLTTSLVHCYGFGVGYHFYVDETQLYVSLDVGNE